jgi:hypothetical protein
MFFDEFREWDSITGSVGKAVDALRVRAEIEFVRAGGWNGEYRRQIERRREVLLELANVQPRKERLSPSSSDLAVFIGASEHVLRLLQALPETRRIALARKLEDARLRKPRERSEQLSPDERRMLNSLLALQQEAHRMKLAKDSMPLLTVFVQAEGSLAFKKGVEALSALLAEASALSTIPVVITGEGKHRILVEYQRLLDSNPEREETLQEFLERHPWLLCPTFDEIYPKLSLGPHVTDFVIREATGDYLLVELERSTFSLFLTGKRSCDPTAELNHARSQISDWKRYIEDNLSTVQRELGLRGITANPSGLIVIGRSATLDGDQRRKLTAMESETPKTRILTYDDVFERANTVVRNFLGPVDRNSKSEVTT